MIKENNSTHWILGGALLLIGLFVIIALVLTRQQAGSLTTQVDNVAPVVADMKICAGNSSDSTCGAVGGPIVPNINGDTIIDVYVKETDANGAADIIGDAFSFRRSSLAPTNCDEAPEMDGNQCYPALGEAPTGDTVWCTADAVTRCRIINDVHLKYWIDPTSATAADFAAENWVTRAEAKDTSNVVGSLEGSMEVAEQTAVSAPAALNFGAHANGFSSGAGDNFDFTFMNQGNTDVNPEIKSDTADGLNCNVIGKIPNSAIKWESAVGASDVAYASMTHTLTDAFQDIGVKDNAGNDASGIRRRANEGVTPAASASFGILIPSGVVGTCQTTISVNVVKATISGAGA